MMLSRGWFVKRLRAIDWMYGQGEGVKTAADILYQFVNLQRHKQRDKDAKVPKFLPQIFFNVYTTFGNVLCVQNYASI